MLRSLRAVLLAATALAMPAALVSSSPAIAQESAQERYVWDLTDLYKTPADWTASYDKTKGEISGLGACKDTIANDSATMLSCLETMSAVLKEVIRLYVYASLKSDENLAIAENTERKSQSQTLLTAYFTEIAWLSPAILAAGAEKVAQFRQEQPKLNEVFNFQLDNILRAAPHTLSSDIEGILALAGDVLGKASDTYDILSAAELPYPTIKLADGREVKIDQAAYTKYRTEKNRDDRKAVFDAFWGTFKAYEGTLGANLANHIAGHVFNAKTRKFENSLQAAIFPDNMPEAVYRTLVAQVNEALPTLHRYFKLRKRMLSIEGDMTYYDIYPPLVQLDKTFDIPASEELTLAALMPLGDEYTGVLKDAWSKRWSHAYPAEGKASGAYNQGAAFDVHTYILLNHNDDYESLSVFAHEWGHGVHSTLVQRYQPFEKADYSTFIAETASIMNEMLLQDHLVKTAQSKEEKLYYLGMALEGMRGTWFRQTMFAEFELKIHEEMEAGQPLSGARISEVYCDLLKRYHGDAEGVVKIDPAYCVEWAYITHFYRNFYVYQYATSITGAALLAARIQSGDPKERDVFLDMLKAGGSDYPYEIYKRAGIDLATPEPYRALAARMNAIMDEMERLLAEP